MIKLCSKIIVIFAASLVIGGVFTNTFAQGQGGPQSGQQGAAMGGGPGGAGVPDGMPEGGMPGGPPGMGGDAKITNPGIYINDGLYLAKESDTKTVSGGKIDNTSASGIMLTSMAEGFNGIYVKGSRSQFTVSDSTIILSGNGTNDFAGIGSATMADGGATLILKKVNITTDGCIRPATTSTGGSTVKVYDSVFKVNGGTLPKGYVAKIGGGMMEVPAPLKITGTSRATLTMNKSKSYFYNTSITAEGWGALSTDMGNGDVYLEANNCDVKVIKSGYGTYADGMGCKVVLNDSKMDVATYMGIIAGDGQTTYNNLNGTSGQNCMMMHTVALEIDQIGVFKAKGGKITTEDDFVLVKSTNADITLDGVDAKAQNSVLIHSIVNDDAKAPKVNGQKVSGYKATLKNMAVAGDIIHEDPDRGMSLILMGTTLKGAIKDASVSMDASSKWMAIADSMVTLMGNIDVNTIDAPAGVKISASAGEGCTLKGVYKLAGGGEINVN